MNSWTAGIDIGMAAFALLSFLAWMNGLNDPALSHALRLKVLSAVFGGFCFSSKYPGLIFVTCILSFNTDLDLGIVEKNWKAGLIESFRMGIDRLLRSPCLG